MDLRYISMMCYVGLFQMEQPKIIGIGLFVAQNLLAMKLSLYQQTTTIFKLLVLKSRDGHMINMRM